MSDQHEPAGDQDGPGVDLGRCLVTGAGGYLGSELVKALARRGLEVRAFDRAYPRGAPAGAEVFTADVRSEDALREACADVDTVFHCASVINTVALARPAVRDEVWSINVGGTEKLLAAARAAGARRFVYTSSVNVVVDRPYAGGDERAPYASGKLDLYTETKAAAEKRVLDADGAPSGDGVLHTAAIRPGGIYGPGEPQHFPRSVREILRGMYVVRIAGGKGWADNVYIDDLVEAHRLAATHLGEGGAANGQAYFINDDEPQSYFDFFGPVAEALGRTPPRLSVPAAPVHAVAFLAELAHYLGGPYPFLTRMELFKLVHHHWFSVDKARRELGWRPRVGHAEGMRRSMDWVRELAERHQ